MSLIIFILEIKFETNPPKDEESKEHHFWNYTIIELWHHFQSRAAICEIGVQTIFGRAKHRGGPISKFYLKAE